MEKVKGGRDEKCLRHVKGKRQSEKPKMTGKNSGHQAAFIGKGSTLQQYYKITSKVNMSETKGSNVGGPCGDRYRRRKKSEAYVKVIVKVGLYRAIKYTIRVVQGGSIRQGG